MEREDRDIKRGITGGARPNTEERGARPNTEKGLNPEVTTAKPETPPKGGSGMSPSKDGSK